jgi:hypothetical protein
MTKSRLSVLCIVTALFAFAVMPLRASDPVGVYCIVDKVVLTPNETEPTSVQIFGAFSFAVPRSSNGTQSKPAGSFGNVNSGDIYAAVQTGYLYYTCAKGKDAVCQSEWADLKSVAGKHEVVGFGARWGAVGSVRKASDKPASPDEYPLNFGVVKLGAKYPGNPELTAALEAALRAK